MRKQLANGLGRFFCVFLCKLGVMPCRFWQELCFLWFENSHLLCRAASPKLSCWDCCVTRHHSSCCNHRSFLNLHSSSQKSSSLSHPLWHDLHWSLAPAFQLQQSLNPSMSYEYTSRTTVVRSNGKTSFESGWQPRCFQAVHLLMAHLTRGDARRNHLM